VIENVRLAVQSRAGIGMNMFSVWFGPQGTDRARRPLPGAGIDAGQARCRVGSLSHGDQRKLEVAILLALEPDILMFDEPTAGMSVDEVPVVLDLIHAGQGERNKTVLLVEHKMDVVRSLADRIIVLHNGTLVADGDACRRHAIEDRTGSLSWNTRNRTCLTNAPDKPLTLSGVHTHIGQYHILQGVDLVVPRGGLSVLLGRNGAGKTTTLRTIMGLWKASAGSIASTAATSRSHATPDIARLGIAYVPEAWPCFPT
jgi:ABC-type branched-subunit amino acid transport system ATPase component